MSRPLKDNLTYFPLDVDFLQDPKIKVLRARFGADGVMFYLYILTAIYGGKGYYVKADEDFELAASIDLGWSVEKIAQLRKFLLERSLLSSKLFQSDTILTARSIQTRYQEAKATIGKKRDIYVEGKYWLLEPSETAPFIKTHPPKSFSEKNKLKSEKNDDKSEIYPQSKGKESKGYIEEDGEAPDLSDPYDFYEYLFSTNLNEGQRFELECLIRDFGEDEVTDLMEEMKPKNIKHPLSYIRKVLGKRSIENMGESNE